MGKVYIDWDAFHRDCNITAAKVNRRFPDVDYMIALSRGGVVPARIMAQTINPEYFLVLGLRLYDEETPGQEVLITQDLDDHEFDRHDRVLIVDDISDRGTTLQFAYSHIFRKTGGAHLYTACPYIKTSTIKRPGSYSKEYSDGDWVVFPFEKD